MLSHHLKNLWQRWLRIGKIIGNFQAQIIFSLFYLIFLSFVGIVMSFFQDPLAMKKSSFSKGKKTNFHAWEHPIEDVEQARKQY